MKIFKVTEDSARVRLVQPTKERELGFYQFDCESKFHEWKEAEVSVCNPKVKPKNFYGLTSGFYGPASGILVFDEKALDICQTVFEMTGEIIPIQAEQGPTLYILNVLECMNGLDYKHTVWDYYEDGTKGRILRYAFHKERIGNESTIFKIPETSMTDILCYTDERDKEDQFYHLCRKHKLTGLIFEELVNF